MPVRPVGNFASMMVFIAANHPEYTNENYPHADLSTPERRLGFVLDHTILCLMRSVGQIAEQREKYEYEDGMSREVMRAAAAQLVIALLVFARELGMKGAALEADMLKRHKGCCGPNLFMAGEMPLAALDSSPTRARAGAIMYRLNSLLSRMGEISGKRNLQPEAMMRSIRSKPLVDTTRRTLIAICADACSLAHALGMTVSDIADRLPAHMPEVAVDLSLD